MGVMFKDENGNLHQAILADKPRSEVILSSGAIGTPQMLLLSGIGPRAHLEKMNISVVLENEFVGKGMADNPMNTVFVPSNIPVEQSLIQTVGITKMGVYLEASSGFGQSSDSIQCHHGIMSAEVRTLFSEMLYIKNRKVLQSTMDEFLHSARQHAEMSSWTVKIHRQQAPSLLTQITVPLNKSISYLSKFELEN